MKTTSTMESKRLFSFKAQLSFTFPMEVWDKVRNADFRFALLKTVAMKNGPVENVYLQMRDSQRPILVCK